jgi:hypothetical protein
VNGLEVIDVRRALRDAVHPGRKSANREEDHGEKHPEDDEELPPDRTSRAAMASARSLSHELE